MRRSTKYHVVMATLRGETAQAVQMDISHVDYGTCPGLWVPKSVMDDDSRELIDGSDEGDEVELHIAGWWFRKNLGEVS